jgi:hypothetical protein
MMSNEMSADSRSIKRKRKQGRAKTARYRATPNGQAKIAAYNNKKTTKIRRNIAKKKRRLSGAGAQRQSKSLGSSERGKV